MIDADEDALTGMYFTIDDAAGSYASGQIIRLASEGVCFVRFEGAEVVLPLELVSLGEMLQTAEDASKLWRFFDTLEERRAWIKWLNAPSRPRVVSLVKPE